MELGMKGKERRGKEEEATRSNGRKDKKRKNGGEIRAKSNGGKECGKNCIGWE